MWMIIIFAPIVLILSIVGILYLIKRYKRHKFIVMLSKLDMAAVVSQFKGSADSNKLNQSLIQAGITYREYNEARLLFVIIGLIVAVAIPMLFSQMIGIIAIIIGVICIVFGGKIYISIAKAERIEKIDRDLGTFLDLVNVILEAGGSLKNSFFTV